MRRSARMMIGICVLGMLMGPVGMAYGQDERGEILKVRESVWRAGSCERREGATAVGARGTRS